MRRRSVPNADLVLSEIGFGCGGNAGLMIRGRPEEQEAAVARAVELGINYFDTAPDYGDGLAEENLGRALRALRLTPIVTSKVEVRKADLADIAGHVVRSVEDSLRRLQVDRLDVLQIHNAPSRSRPDQPDSGYQRLWIEDYLRPGGAIDGLERVLQAGKVRHLGFVCRGDDVEGARALMGTGKFQLLNVPYSLLNPTAGMRRPDRLEVDGDGGGVIDAALALGVGVAIYSPLAAGLLTNGFVQARERHPLAQVRAPGPGALRDRARAAKLAFLAEGGASLAQAATRFVLAHPGVTTVIGGFSDIAQMEEIAAVSGAGPLPTAQMARLDALWRSNFDA